MSESTSRAANLGWAAGMIDGEGMITLHKGRTNCYCVELHVGNTNLAALEDLRNIFGGRGWIGPSQKPIPGRKQNYAWRVYSQNAADIIAEVGVHLRIKRPQAEIVLEYQRNRDLPRRGCKALTKEEVQTRSVLVGIIRALNGRGK